MNYYRKENSILDPDSSPAFGFNQRRSQSANFNKSDRIRTDYPSHGVIQSSSTPPGWLDLGQLHRHPSKNSTSGCPEVPKNYRKRKIDLENAVFKCNSPLCKIDHEKQKQFGTNADMDVNEGRKTSDLYPTETNLPERFNNPSWFKGYGCERDQHPFYRTSSSAYGLLPPNIHTMPLKYQPAQKIFSENLASAGMQRNRSLNTK